MLELHHRVSPKELVVGWYSSTAKILPSSASINDFYRKEMDLTNAQITPVHLTLDTDLQNLSLTVRTLTSIPIGFPSLAKTVSSAGDEQQQKQQLGIQFIPLPNEIKTSPAENTALDLMSQVCFVFLSRVFWSIFLMIVLL
jgi:translation initiation factor 3 subunit F